VLPTFLLLAAGRSELHGTKEAGIPSLSLLFLRRLHGEFCLLMEERKAKTIPQRLVCGHQAILPMGTR
jgi:hypothetical protein